MFRKKQLEASIKPESRLVAKKISPNGGESVRVVDRHAQSVVADYESTSQLAYEVKGTSRQNEQGVLTVCRHFADHLRSSGIPVGVVSIPTGNERGIDCELPTDGRILQVQVVRPSTNLFWTTLRKFGIARRALTVEEAVEDLVKIITRKAQRTAVADRREIHLVLDATETVVHSMEAVVSRIKLEQMELISNLHFSGVWVVGPESSQVHRLDEQGAV